MNIGDFEEPGLQHLKDVIAQAWNALTTTVVTCATRMTSTSSWPDAHGFDQAPAACPRRATGRSPRRPLCTALPFRRAPAMLRMKYARVVRWVNSLMRTRSPRIAPPVKGEEAIDGPTRPPKVLAQRASLARAATSVLFQRRPPFRSRPRCAPTGCASLGKRRIPHFDQRFRLEGRRLRSNVKPRERARSGDPSRMAAARLVARRAVSSGGEFKSKSSRDKAGIARFPCS